MSSAEISRCTCDQCVASCYRRPGFMAPAQAEALIGAGHSGRLLIDRVCPLVIVVEAGRMRRSVEIASVGRIMRRILVTVLLVWSYALTLEADGRTSKSLAVGHVFLDLHNPVPSLYVRLLTRLSRPQPHPQRSGRPRWDAAPMGRLTEQTETASVPALHRVEAVSLSQRRAIRC